MNIKLVTLFLIASILVGQAQAADEINSRRGHKVDRVVMKHTSSPKLRSSIALIYDVRDQRALYTKDSDSIVPIASVSKLMTAMVILDAKLSMDEMIQISEADMDMLKNTHSRMSPGMTLTRGDLIKFALMSSENRAAAALARTYPGGTEATVAKMNAKAIELGMTNTRFLDPTGLNSGNVSTAQDLVRMVMAAQNYEAIHKATTTTSRFLKLNGYRPLLYKNTNPLVKNKSWHISISKTGYINEAGHCLVMGVSIKRRPIVIVLLDSTGTGTRISDAKRAKKWVENSLAHANRRG